MKITTSLFTDKHDYSKNPQLSHLTYSSKRLIYWQCCLTFFSSSIKVNPNEQHVLYTNDSDEISFNGIDLRQFLINLGVEIIYLPMEEYKVPTKFSSFLTGAFYKLEVINALGKANTADVCLLDSDCIWIKPCDPIKQIISNDNVVLFDVYKVKDIQTEDPHGTTRKELFEVFQQISPDYPNSAPFRFGGEILAGNTKNIRIIAKRLTSAFQQILHDFDELPKFKNGKKFMDGMEVFSSYVYNILPLEHVDSEELGILRRIWTDPHVNNVSPNDKNLVIWHLIAEKNRGIPILSKVMLDKNSAFWKLEDDKIPEYLGGYLGIPERKVKLKETSFLKKLYPTIKNKINQKFSTLKSYL